MHNSKNWVSIHFHLAHLNENIYDINRSIKTILFPSSIKRGGHLILRIDMHLHFNTSKDN